MIRFIRIKIYDNTFKNSLRRKGWKVIFITIKICSASYIVLNWYLLKVEMNLGHAIKQDSGNFRGVLENFRRAPPSLL